MFDFAAILTGAQLWIDAGLGLIDPTTMIGGAVAAMIAVVILFRVAGRAIGLVS